MGYVCERDQCAGCMLCADICPSHAISVRIGFRQCNAEIDEERCTDCGLCHKMCPQGQDHEFRAPISWHQGWSVYAEERGGSSSGGIASELSRRFLESGGEVCTCIFHGGEFRLRFLNGISDVERARGSKYVKSDASGIYVPFLEKLRAGKQVLMIALPCQIAAAIDYAGEYGENLYTVDMVCHGTPSVELLETYLREKGYALADLQDIKFRTKGNFYLQGDYKPIEEYHMDAYTYAFLQCLTYTENCYQCKYARPERISDMTIGDSWGSELGEDEVKKGISLILCQTKKGERLLEMARLELRAVDLEKAIAANRQLSAPSVKAKGREAFFDGIEAGKGFDKMLSKVDPIRGAKNFVKKHIIRRPVGGGYDTRS